MAAVSPPFITLNSDDKPTLGSHKGSLVVSLGVWNAGSVLFDSIDQAEAWFDDAVHQLAVIKTRLATESMDALFQEQVA